MDSISSTRESTAVHANQLCGAFMLWFMRSQSARYLPHRTLSVNKPKFFGMPRLFGIWNSLSTLKNIYSAGVIVNLMQIVANAFVLKMHLGSLQV